jgi:hypothetical protein
MCLYAVFSAREHMWVIADSNGLQVITIWSAYQKVMHVQMCLYMPFSLQMTNVCVCVCVCVCAYACTSLWFVGEACFWYVHECNCSGWQRRKVGRSVQRVTRMPQGLQQRKSRKTHVVRSSCKVRKERDAANDLFSLRLVPLTGINFLLQLLSEENARPADLASSI